MACALLLALPSIAPGQDVAASRIVVGAVVVSPSNSPIAGVVIRSIGDGDVSNDAPRAVSGRTGQFRLRISPSVTRIVAARLGFAPETLQVRNTDSSLVVRLREAPLSLGAMLVQAEPSFSAASSSTIRSLDIALRPRESTQELLSLAPGLVIAQHAGGGKAEQIFLRGFDADHGTDVAISMDGTPVNMVSHGHGQGYADLHYVMPEVIERADVRKGPYDARDGDFSTAGAVAFHSKDRLDASALSIRAGTFATRHLTALVPFGGTVTESGGYAAFALHGTNGPTLMPQGYGRANGFAKWTMPVGTRALAFATGSGFGAHWDASGQIPERAVASGRIGRFGSIDPTEGGATERYDASIGLRSSASGDDEWQARLFATRYRFSLFSNFTFFSRDSVNGDEIQQTDRRTMIGGEAWRSRSGMLLGRRVVSRAGAGFRGDAIDVGLSNVRERTLLEPVLSDRVRQSNGYVWASQDLQLASRLRLQLGVRGDLFHFGLTDRLGNVTSVGDRASDTRTEAIVSPKLSVAYDVATGTTLFANAGTGFHSNDARGVVSAPQGATVLPRATAGEVGSRYNWARGSVAAALWALQLESELVYSGDEGTTSQSGRTRRTGIDLEGRVAVTPWLWADADLNLSRGRFLDESASANRIPLAPTITSVGGLSIRDIGPFAAGARYRYVGARPASEDNSVVARGHWIAESFASVRLSRVTLSVAVDNVFNAAWNEAQFATTSRLRGEPADVTELNFTPGAPRAIQLGVQTRF